jgi:hypothetical protein
MNNKLPVIDGFLLIMIIFGSIIVGFHLFLGV